MKAKALLILFLTSVMVNAQIQSVHQAQNDFYKEHFSEIKKIEPEFVTGKSNSISRLNKKVFGFLSWWERLAGTHKNIRYDLLTHLAVFSFEADAAGNLKDPYGWPWNDVIISSSAAGVKLMATISNFNGDDIHALLADSGKRENLFSNIKLKLTGYGFNGVNIDFENLRDEDKPAAFGNFIGLLNNYLKSISPNYEVSVSTPVVNFSGWNFSSIAQNCDYLFVMCYDFYGSWSITTGPSSPFQGTYYSVNKSFGSYYSSLVSSSPQKLIMGVPYYGNYWRTKTKDAYTPVDTSTAKKEFVMTLKYREIIPSFETKEKMWDNVSLTPWLRWQDSNWNQIWYDNDSSLAVKYNYAIEKKLGGVGIWALGYDSGREELWKLIERKFTGTVEINNDASVPAEFKLYQNYPNPFNPATVISYQLSASSHVTLKVYDLLGREVATLVNEEKLPGVYNSQFPPNRVSSILNSQLPSGVYVYKLHAGNFVSTKKMLLMK